MQISSRRSAFMRWVGGGVCLLLVVLVVLIAAYDGDERPPDVPRTDDRSAPNTSGVNSVASVPSQAVVAAPDASAAARVPAVVKGSVVDQSGKPIAGAQVTSSLPGKEVAAVLAATLKGGAVALGNGRTNAQGAFAFEVSPPGIEFFIRADARGYNTIGRWVPVPEEGVERLVLEMEAAGVVSGRVEDLSGQPLSGMIVVATFGYPGHTGIGRSEPTGKDGKFKFEFKKGGACRVVVRYAKAIVPGLPDWRLSLGNVNDPLTILELRTGEKRRGVRLTLPWEGSQSIEGTVVNTEERPLAGATVWAECRDRGGGVPPTGVANGVTGADGRFRIQGFYPVDDKCVEAHLYVRCSDYESVVLQGVRLGDRNVRITMEEARAGAIAGVVRDAVTRDPVTDARVFLGQVIRADRSPFFEYPEGEMAIRVREGGGGVDRKGRFVISDVPDGIARLAVYTPTYGYHTRDDIAVQPGQTTECEVLMAPPGVLQVDVRYTGAMAGHEADEVDLRCWPAGEAGGDLSYGLDMQAQFKGETWRGALMPESSYELTLAPGDYDVMLMTRDLDRERPMTALSKNRWWAEASVASGQRTTIQMEAGGSGSIEGTVADMFEDKRTYVYLLHDRASSALDMFGDPSALLVPGGCVAQNRVMDDGRFAINCLRPGDYTLALIERDRGGSGPYELLASRSIRVSEGQTQSVDFP